MRKTVIFIAVFSLLLISCAKKEFRKVDAAGNLYVQGIEFMKKKKYDKAIENFNKIRENYPFDPLALVADVKLGDAHFARKEWQMAATVYEDFVNGHPEDENAPYVMKQIGLSYEKLSPSLDRDQANTYKAVERFTFLKNRYPQSRYAQDADTHIKALTAKLAGREFYVGEFYHKTYRYNAAIMRLEYLLSKFPDTKDREKALHYLSEDYGELDKPEKGAQYAEQLKREFPRSIFISNAPRERKTLRMAKASPQPAAPVVRDFSYEERKSREIDLRPIETPADREATVAQQSPGQTQAPAPPTATNSAVAPQAPAAGRAVQETPRTTASPSPGAETGTESTRAGAQQQGIEGQTAAGQGKTPASEEAARKAEESAKPGGRKDSLGFFASKKPIDVVADTMEGREKGKVIVFTGNVIAKQEDLYLFSDTLTAYMNEESNEIERAKAKGNVKIVKLDRTATCKEADFYNDRGEIVLRGDVVVFSGNDKVSGETVTYYINETVCSAGSEGKRAKALITPKH
jgi:outer membrane protein assembly factor BamD